ncbi:hypothetical protein GUJ93_ZPchr0012g20561 [Zizania palustris]|uniref:Uncharacterized protein n=1 Tax=Zizania palustris TaxID=103762 RepID=A0A8J5WP67_ZIZPA|nr:hypothetical protein GUJ93_ZPchr0012g20561 [Zizania palustris]
MQTQGRVSLEQEIMHFCPASGASIRVGCGVSQHIHKSTLFSTDEQDYHKQQQPEMGRRWAEADRYPYAWTIGHGSRRSTHDVGSICRNAVHLIK